MGFTKIAAIVVLALAGGALGLRMLVIKIRPGETGILNAEWTVGLVKKDFAPGYHWNVGPLHTWVVFDTTVQTLHMVRSARQGQGDVYGPLVIKSTEGADVKLDVTLKYRITPGKTWQVFDTNGPGNAYKNRVWNIARDVMRVELGGLNLEAFYKAQSRKQVAEQMEAALRKRMAEMNVELITILIRDLEFEPRFQKTINDKTLATQQKELNIALGKVAEARGKTDKIKAETQANVIVINQEKEKTIVELRAENDKKIKAIEADYERKVTETRSDADLYVAQKEAEGIKLVKQAEAEAEGLKREALATAGGDTLVALELMRNLKFGEMLISTQQTDPLDVETLMRKLGIR